MRASIARLESKVDEHKRQSDLQHHFVLGVLVEQGKRVITLEDEARVLKEAREAEEREMAEREAIKAKTPSRFSKIMQMADKKDKK